MPSFSCSAPLAFGALAKEDRDIYPPINAAPPFAQRLRCSVHPTQAQNQSHTGASFDLAQGGCFGLGPRFWRAPLSCPFITSLMNSSQPAPRARVSPYLAGGVSRTKRHRNSHTGKWVDLQQLARTIFCCLCPKACTSSRRNSAFGTISAARGRARSLLPSLYPQELRKHRPRTAFCLCPKPAPRDDAQLLRSSPYARPLT